MIINESFLFERVGDQVVVLDSATRTVIAVSDESSKTLREVLDGAEVTPDAPGIAELIDQGILLPTHNRQLSRRSLVAAGGAVGAGSVLALGLPAAAAASSPEVIRPRAPEIEVDGNGIGGTYDIDGQGAEDILTDIYDLVIENLDDYDLDETTFLWAFTDDPDDTRRPFDFLKPDEGELLWEDPAGPVIPAGALDNDDNLTIFVFASVGGVLSDPTPVLLEDD